MDPVLVHIRNSGNAAVLYSEHVQEGGEVNFRSDTQEESRIVLLDGIPFEG